MPWDDSYPEEGEPVKPVTVGEIRHATAQAQPGLEPLIYDEQGNRFVIEKVRVVQSGGKPRLVMQARLEQPAMTTTPTKESDHAAS